jgi:predicted HTH transcriptional regulator
MEYTESDIVAFLKKGESEILEYKRDVSTIILTKIISAFANSCGGLILVGVDENPRRYSVPTVVGINPERLRRVYSATLNKITPQPRTVLSMVTVNGKSVGVIEVEKSDRLVVSDEGVFDHRGTSVQAMSPSSILEVIKQSNEKDQLEEMARSMSQLTHAMEEMRKQQDASGSWKNKFTDYILAGIVGAIISFMITALI